MHFFKRKYHKHVRNAVLNVCAKYVPVWGKGGNGRVITGTYCLTKISIRAKRSISRVFSLFIVPSPFFVHCLYKDHINRAENVLTGLKPY